MRYTPYTESEIQSMHVLEGGIYAFKVLDVLTTDKNNMPMVDKNGNDMAKLKLCVWDNEQKERIIYTFISGDGAFSYKLRHFAKSIGMLVEYETNAFNIHRTVGLSGMAEVVIKKGTIKADGSGEMWPDRNDIKDFVCDVKPTITQPSTKPFDDTKLDDDCPF